MVAIVRKYQRTEVEQSVNPVPVKASETSLGRLGEGLSDVGDMFFEWQDEVDTADAKAADAAYSDLIRQELYGDQSGYMYSQGGDAMNLRGSVSERIEAEQARILEELSPGARARAQSAMEARRQRALLSIDQHANGQRRSYLDSAAEARVTATINDAIYNPDLVLQSLNTNRTEILDMADRNGWSPEVTELKLRESETKIYGGVVERLAIADPIRALEYLRENRDKMLGAEVARLESRLVPMAREYRGRAAGAAAATGAIDPRTFDWSKYSTGRAATRADSFTGLNPEFASRVANMLVAAEADGINLRITSAYRSNELQAALFARAVERYGSEAAARKWVAPPGRSQHNTGMAVDFASASGGLLRDAGSAEAKWLQANAERFGLHLPMSWEPWQVEMSGSRGGAAIEPTAISGGGIESLLGITDPDERAAAISEYNLRIGIQAKQVEAGRQAAEDAAFQMIEAGGNINDLPLEYRQHIGREAMNSLRIYQERVASGQPVLTDDAFYVQLADMMSQSPEEFMRTDPMTWRDKLDDGDFQYFVKQRADLIAGRREAGADGPSISSLRTASSTALKAAGVDDDPQVVATFERDLLRWSAAFAEREGRNPSALETNARINEMLVPVVIDPKGLGNKQDGFAFQMDYDGRSYDPNDDVTPAMLRDGALTINDISVSNDMMETFAQGFEIRFGRAPTVQELIEGMIASGLYDE